MFVLQGTVDGHQLIVEAPGAGRQSPAPLRLESEQVLVLARHAVCLLYTSLWMKVANLTAAAGNSTALVGTPEQVAEAMLRYYDLGITAFVLKGFDPLNDAVDYGKHLLPLLREDVYKRQ